MLKLLLPSKFVVNTTHEWVFDVWASIASIRQSPLSNGPLPATWLTPLQQYPEIAFESWSIQDGQAPPPHSLQQLLPSIGFHTAEFIYNHLIKSIKTEIIILLVTIIDNIIISCIGHSYKTTISHFQVFDNIKKLPWMTTHEWVFDVWASIAPIGQSPLLIGPLPPWWLIPLQQYPETAFGTISKQAGHAPPPHSLQQLSPSISVHTEFNYITWALFKYKFFKPKLLLLLVTIIDIIIKSPGWLTFVLATRFIRDSISTANYNSISSLL